MKIILILGIAFILDLIFGDPKKLPHPVRLMGKLIEFGEKFIRRIFPKTEKWERRGGLILAVSLLAISFFTPFVLILIAHKIAGIFGVLLEILLCYQVLGMKSMGKEATSIYNGLKRGDLEGSRKNLSMIVGRDTSNLDEKGMVKAAVESVSESACDGVVAPLFFMVIGGAPLGFLYKAANTLDSMVGYKNDKYMNFGYYSAKIDDILNFIPARITGFLYIFASYCLGFNGKGASKIFFRDRLKHPSPNSAHAEAAAAGALNIALGGGSCYAGKFVEKPIIGDDLQTPVPEDIMKALQMFYLTSIWALILFCFIRFLVYMTAVLA